ncbi:MAG TPA: cysteine hydrolase [Verrucomicrobiae bacterium]|nr:cysteine hydrolase [Verrucomicrobiae bacterium]
MGSRSRGDAESHSPSVRGDDGGCPGRPGEPDSHSRYWNTAIVDELGPQASDVVLYKTRYSGFYGTDLDTVLRGRGVRSLVVTGWTTSVCVESTIRDAFFRDYRCILVEDCAAEPMGHGLPRGNHEASVLTIQMRFGWVSSSTKVIRALEARASAKG